jgi:hypothetical protein
METRATTPRNGLAIFVIMAIALLLFSLVAAFSIGIFILPIPLVMFVSIRWWDRPGIVASLIGAAVVFSIVFLGTAPVRCGISSVKESGRPVMTRERCTRLFLPDIEGRSGTRSSDILLALGIAAAAAGITGLAGVGIGRALRGGKAPAA